ncbi:adenosinetriphosphatase [Fonsecaea monophora]|uniref:Adenosinetriphosphatase n=1 Tax=Fonsecaea monophora TaxID=254056 RepID=A0A177EQP2_9EURO|nr:adenosinetriphosphatase [Fonsecaea monophora]OAG33771.1 adenosinetriphosphatase [Fonsecaea monophora]
MSTKLLNLAAPHFAESSWERLYTLVTLLLMLVSTAVSLTFGLLTVVGISNSFIQRVRQFLWKRFTTEREDRVVSIIHAHLMHHDAHFFDGTDKSDSWKCRRPAHRRRLRRLMAFPRIMTYGDESLHRPAGDIDVNNVSFSYVGEKGPKRVFRRLSLKITGGQGHSHQRSVWVWEINPLPARPAHPTSPRMPQHMSLMMQFPNVFRDAMKENIRYGLSDATDDEVESAAKEAGVHEVIMGLKPDFYDTVHGTKRGA